MRCEGEIWPWVWSVADVPPAPDPPGSAPSCSRPFLLSAVDLLPALACASKQAGLPWCLKKAWAGWPRSTGRGLPCRGLLYPRAGLAGERQQQGVVPSCLVILGPRREREKKHSVYLLKTYVEGGQQPRPHHWFTLQGLWAGVRTSG